MAELAYESLSTQKVYKVSEITREIRSLLESSFRSIWIEGEISNYKHHSSGHIYFTLKDESAQINCVFFARENRSLKFEPKSGLQVICAGRISVYEPRGTYQVYVQRMEPKGIGALQLAFLQMKEKLEKEGLFQIERKKEIPNFPRSIAVVTSPTGAAIQDMLKIFRKCQVGLHVYIYPVRVQGEGAAEEIAKAITDLNDANDIDLIIAGRGGGSLEDLWCFNDENVARSMSQSRLPIISAVGHEIDWTIADMVADYRAHTPTAAAELIVMHWDELENRMREHRERMVLGIENWLSLRRDTLLNIRESYAFKQPLSHLDQWKQCTDDLSRNMQNYFANFLQHKKQSFQNLIAQMEALSPLSVLKRGYSLTYDDRGKVVRQAKQLKVGQATLND